jgi:hypothetical protein
LEESSTSRYRSTGIYVSSLVLLAVILPLAGGFPKQRYDASFGVMIQPSSIVLKVGEKTEVNVTVSNPDEVSGGRVCYSLEGFPASGFRTSFTLECSDSQHRFSTVLTVEVTPAAAPQSVTAYVVASSGNQTAQAVLSVSVEPAMPAWIPWLGLLLFFSILVVAIAWKPRLKAERNRRANRKERKL